MWIIRHANGGYNYGTLNVSPIVTTAMLNRVLDNSKYPQGYAGKDCGMVPYHNQHHLNKYGIAKVRGNW